MVKTIFQRLPVYNPFADMAINELMDMYPTYEEFIKTGVIASKTRLGQYRDEYVKRYEMSGLHLMEDNYLRAVADKTYEKYKEREKNNEEA